MKPLTLFTAVACASICGCSATRLSLDIGTPRSVLELKDICMRQSIQSDEVFKADSLFAAAEATRKKEDPQRAQADLDLSTIYYRLAIAKTELGAKQKKIADLEKTIQTAEEKLASYKKVMLELQSK
jgi:hypothetical protein